MRSRIVATMYSAIFTALIPGCAGEPDGGDRHAAGVRFERLEVAGVTTDHASTGGVSWADYDNDGDLDLLVTNGYDVSADSAFGQRNRLYRNDGAAGLVEVTTGALATSTSISSGHTWGDYDNDGDLDVFIANQQDEDNLLFRNEGDGTFAQITDEPPATDGGHSYTATWVDVDGDGWLDLFVANGGMSHVGPNALYRGTGDGHFEKITEGTIVTDEAATCGVAWGDYDNDGDLDLFVANTGFSPPTNHNALYRNDGDWSFTRIQDIDAVTDGKPSSTAIWVDIDNDLDLDLHVTTMYGLAGLLYRNDGTGALTLVEDSPLSLDSGYPYGANFEDYDNDGDIDVVCANWGAAPAYYRNDGTGHFERALAGALTGHLLYAGAIASGDYDGDGKLDVYVGNWPNHPGDGERNALYRNAGDAGHWLKIRFAGTKGGRPCLGARVVVTSPTDGGTLTQMREVTSQSGFRGQSAVNPHFGLGAATTASVEITWPSGRVQTLTNIPADQAIDVSDPVREE